MKERPFENMVGPRVADRLKSLKTSDLEALEGKVERKKLAKTIFEEADEELLGVIESEIHRQVDALLHAEEVHDRKVKTFIRFLEEDMSRCIHRAVEEGVTKKARNPAALERLANEASLNIHQILIEAKKEFGGGDVPSDLRDPLMVEVEKLDEQYSVAHIFDTLRDRLGVRYVDQLRARMQSIVLETQARFHKKGSDPKQLPEVIKMVLTRLEGECTKARAEIPVKEKEIRKQVEEDLSHLEEFYLNRETLTNKITQK